MAHFEEKNKILLIFNPIYWFDQKSCLKQIQIFLKICPISNMLRKTNFLSISVLFSEIVIFGLKREVLCEFLQKCFKKKKHKFSCMWLSLRRKISSCLYFPHITDLIKNSCLNKSKFSSGFALFKLVKKNKLSEYFCALFWDSHFLD